MQSNLVVAGMDALSESCENILTRRANQRHYSIIAQFVKRPSPCPKTGASARLQSKNPYPQLKFHRLAPEPVRRIGADGVIRRSRPQAGRKTARAGAAPRSALAELTGRFGVAAPIDRKHSRA